MITPVSFLGSTSQDFDSILPLASFANRSIARLDSISKIRFAEEMLAAFAQEQGVMAGNIPTQVQIVLRMLLESAINSPVTVSDYYRIHYPEVDGMYAPAAVLERAKAAFGKLEEALSLELLKPNPPDWPSLDFRTLAIFAMGIAILLVFAILKVLFFH